MAYQYPITLRTFRLDTSSNLYFEVNVPAVGVSAGAASAGQYPYLNEQGQIDSSFLPAAHSLSLETNGVLNPLQTLLNLKSGANITLTADAQGGVTVSASGTVSISFDHLASATNTTSNLVVGSGASLTATGTGVIEATELQTPSTPVNVSGNAPTHAGQLLISQPGNTTAVWADPLVQGLQADGSLASTLNPVLMAGSDGTNIHSIATDLTGQLKVLVENSPVVSVSNFPASQTINGTITANQGTSPWVVSLASTTITGTVAVTQSTSPWVVNFSAPQHVVVDSGSVSVSNFPATQPVSGSVSVSNFPTTQPVSGSVSVSNLPLPTLFFTVQATAAGSTLIWTPTSGRKFQLMRFFIQTTANAALASPGILTIQFYDGNVAMPVAFDVWLPMAGTSGNADALETGWIDLGPGILSSAANNVLNINLSQAILPMSVGNQGNVRVVACGVEV